MVAQGRVACELTGSGAERGKCCLVEYLLLQKLCIRRWDKQRAGGSTAPDKGVESLCSKNGSVELILVLFPETVPSREELPAALLVHLPNVGLLKERQMEEN